MPIYGYQCKACGHQFEVLQKMSDAPLKTCPKCSGELRKLVYAAGIVYKGSGYYSTDYKAGSKGSSKAAANGSEGGSEGGSDRGSEAGSEGGGETKPAKEPAAPKSESKGPETGISKQKDS